MEALVWSLYSSLLVISMTSLWMHLHDLKMTKDLMQVICHCHLKCVKLSTSFTDLGGHCESDFIFIFLKP